MKKGFTLIELLAVIVILAIIALIATPIILGIISDARNEAKLRSAELYLTGLEQAIIREKMKNTKFNPGSCEINAGVVICEGKAEPLKVDIDGDLPESGTIELSNGKITSYDLVINEEQIVDGVIQGTVTPQEPELDAEALEAIEIVRKYIEEVEKIASSTTTGPVNILKEDNSYFCDATTAESSCYWEQDYESGEIIVTDGAIGQITNLEELPTEGDFYLENGKVVSEKNYDHLGIWTYIKTYFKVGEYYVYYDLNNGLAASKEGVPVCLASSSKTYGVGYLASEGNPYALGVQYVCNGENYFVFENKTDELVLMESVGGETSAIGIDVPTPSKEQLIQIGGEDLSEESWLTAGNVSFWTSNIVEDNDDVVSYYYFDIPTRTFKIGEYIWNDGGGVGYNLKKLITVKKSLILY